jgi:hypothetical protein
LHSLWRGSFGDAYTERNRDLPSRVGWWKDVLPPDVKNVFEVGCNVGTNLQAIDSGIQCYGLEINAKAGRIARGYGLNVTDSTWVWADLVFTVGVLIHQDTPELIRMLRQMHEHAKKYVLFSEYFSSRDLDVEYHGRTGVLFKRNYGAIYDALFPDDTLVRQGAATQEDGFDDTEWRLYDVRNSASKNGKRAASRESTGKSRG